MDNLFADRGTMLVLFIAALVALLGVIVLWRGAVGGRLSAQRATHAATEAARQASAEVERHADAQARAEDAAREAGEKLSVVEARLAAMSQAREEQALRAGQSETREEGLRTALDARVAEVESLRSTLQTARDEGEVLGRQLAQAQLAARKDAEAAAREIALLRELRKDMTDQFRLLADETLRTTGTDLQTRYTEQLSALLTPFRDQVATFQTELQTREQQTSQERARLGEHIRLLHERSEQIGAEAVALTRALKGEKQKQGAWGEMILARLLEDSGLERDVHYLAQESLRDETGKLWRPDVILRLPQKKVLVIDSKVSLNAYAEASDSADDEARDRALKRHVAAIRTHVQTLSDKGYETLDEGSVDYVMMFVPIEGAYAEAVRADAELVGWALQKRVAVMTPATLMLALRIVDHIWTVERRESNAAAIAHRAGQMYDKLHGVVEALDDVGSALGKAQQSHAQAMSRLSTGPGNVIRQAEQVRALGARPKKQLRVDHDQLDAEDACGAHRPALPIV